MDLIQSFPPDRLQEAANKLVVDAKRRWRLRSDIVDDLTVVLVDLESMVPTRVTVFAAVAVKLRTCARQVFQFYNAE